MCQIIDVNWEEEVDQEEAPEEQQEEQLERERLEKEHTEERELWKEEPRDRHTTENQLLRDTLKGTQDLRTEEKHTEGRLLCGSIEEEGMLTDTRLHTSV